MPLSPCASGYAEKMIYWNMAQLSSSRAGMDDLTGCLL